MTDYLGIIQAGENEQLEFKKSSSLLKDAVVSICAMANKHGGTVIFGVSDNGGIIGQTVSDDTLKNIANTIKLNTEPRLFPQVEKIILEGKDCIAISIEESPLKPHTAFGRPYLRVGPTNQQMDQATYAHYLEAKYNGYGFDHQLMENATLHDIDEEAVAHFLNLANENRSLGESLYAPVQTILEKLDLMKNGKVTRAAMLLFGKKPGLFFEGQYEVKCGAFPADDSYDVFTANREFSGNLFSIFDAVYSFVADRLAQSYTKGEKNGKASWELPLTAIREAIINMLIHKDYRQGIKSTVEVRPSYLRFYNPGHLFQPNITLENLLLPHPSKPGNKLIAKTFFWAGLAETWGSGTLKIAADMKNAGKPAPLFNYQDGMFELRIFRK